MKAEQATDEGGNETRCLFTQLLSRRLFVNADYHEHERITTKIITDRMRKTRMVSISFQLPQL